MANMVKDEQSKGCVYGMDIQEDAIKNTSSLLDVSLNPVERKCVKLFPICHSRMVEVLPKNCSVRLVAFNLGYLPGGKKDNNYKVRYNQVGFGGCKAATSSRRSY